jgi:hypothetical protein
MLSFNANSRWNIISFTTLQILTRYRDDDDFQLEIRMISALAFVPVDDARNYYLVSLRILYIFPGCTYMMVKKVLRDQPAFDVGQGLNAQRTQLQIQTGEFFEYFESTWVGQRRRRAWTQPLFPLEMWNTYQAVLNDQHRTNNNLEGWHTRFESLIGGNHPNYMRFVEFLKQEEDLNRMQAVQFLAGGNIPPSRVKYRLLNDRIKTVVEDFGNRTILGYLRSIAHNLSFV